MDKKLNLYQVWGSVKSYFYVIAEDPTSALKKVQGEIIWPGPTCTIRR